MSADAIIFDIDGTLWNASEASANGWNQGLRRLGIDRKVTARQMESVAGQPFERCVDILLPGLRLSHPTLLETLNASERAIVEAEGGRFYDGVVEGIHDLADHCQVFLVSNCQEWYLDLFLKHSGLRTVLAGADCHGLSGEPKEAMLTRLKHRHALAHPVYVGDTASDETAARLAEVTFIHAAWGFGAPAGEPVAVHSFAELVRCVTQPSDT